MTRSIEFSIGEFYHIYNRGSDKRKIFETLKDHDRFISLLYLCNSTKPVHISLQGKDLNELLKINREEKLVEIGAYCLMPNHFHLLLRECCENGISRFMQKLTTGYTMYFNKKNDRTGNLFQGVFKATHVDNDEYLEYLFSYIHLNPVKLIQPDWKERGVGNLKKSKQFLQSYKYSSYPEYINLNRLNKVILNTENFPNYFNKTTDFKKLIEFWLKFKDDTTNIKAKP